MDHPSQIFNRIRRQKARPPLPRQGRDIPLPSPAPVGAPFPAQSPAPVGMPFPAQSPAPAEMPFPAQSPSVPAQAPAPTPTPAPTPASAPTHPPAPAKPARGHALYSQVMRSHDRMGTRHV